jgi:hypothetical protein
MGSRGASPRITSQDQASRAHRAFRTFLERVDVGIPVLCMQVSVPFMMATARGAAPSRIGSVSARWTGA